MVERSSVAVCFSGGDAASMNAFQRAIVRVGLNRHHARVLGIKDGYGGLVRAAERQARGEQSAAALEQTAAALPGRQAYDRRGVDLVRLDHAAVSGLCRFGGAVLGVGRCLAFHEPDVRLRAAELLRALGIRTFMVCGGEGSLTGAACLARESGLQVIGIPATIDNDVPATDMALGVDTAVNNVVWAVERVADTGAAHGRIMVLETMGRNSGNLARLSALAAGAEICVTPERGPLNIAKMQGIAERLENSLERGRHHGIVLVAEGVKLDAADSNPTMALAAYLQNHFRRAGSPFPELETRACVLGHLQRGGSPTAADRILAARFAEAAWEAASADKARSGVVGLRRGEIQFQPFDADFRPEQSAAMTRLYELLKAISK